MEACLVVEQEIDKVNNKFTSLSKSVTKTIDEQINQIEKLKTVLEETENSNLNSVEKTDLKHSTLQISEAVGKIATEHRDLHRMFSNVRKAIDKKFANDFDATSLRCIPSSGKEQALLNEVILQHLHRQGHLHIAETLAQEADVQLSKTYNKDVFLELNRTLEALRCRDLQPALAWAAENRDALNKQNSTLELQLHKLKFVDLLLKGNKMDVISYARTVFPLFVRGQERQVQSLMGAVMYAGSDLKTSPYSHLLDPCLWSEIEETFLRDACALMGLPIESPLAVAVNAGCNALPALLNIKQVMQQRKVSGAWNAKDELPIEIDLPGNMRFHSVFACPILRRQVSSNNPPMRLTCGHVISSEALSSLTTSHKLKCPLCPMEQNPNDARAIYF